MDLDVDDAGPGQRKLVKTLGEFGRYIGANANSIPNYGERHRSGEAISNAFVESAGNQVVSKCMVKKQQMRWTARGAHLLLQVRTRVLNDELADAFRRWYPEFVPQGSAGGMTSHGLFRSPSSPVRHDGAHDRVCRCDGSSPCDAVVEIGSWLIRPPGSSLPPTPRYPWHGVPEPSALPGAVHGCQVRQCW